MTDFIVTITDPDQLAGITWAREEYNKTIAPPPPPLDSVTGGMAMPPPTPGTQVQEALIESDQDYVQHVMNRASISYADQKLRAEYVQHYEDAQAAADLERKKRQEPVAREPEEPMVPRRK